MTRARGVPLYFITGFLGSGKTTLLNRALDEAAEKGIRLGVIINEWGQVSIDSGLVPHGDGKELEIEELNNGQVFCSCLTADFINALQLFAKKDLDAVIVETSGMANPFPLQKLLEDLSEKTGDHYQYGGMIALVDPENFLELQGVINAVEEQVGASGRIIINKIDLAKPDDLAKVKESIAAINPAAEVVETTQAKIDSFFRPPRLNKQPRKLSLGAFKKPAPDYPRPANYVLTFQDAVPIERIRAFMQAILPDALRIKGIIRADDSSWNYVDGVNARVEERQIAVAPKEPLSKIVVIPKGGTDIADRVSSLWNDLVGVDFTLA